MAKHPRVKGKKKRERPVAGSTAPNSTSNSNKLNSLNRSVERSSCRAALPAVRESMNQSSRLRQIDALFRTEVLIVGSGIAGLLAAIEFAEKEIPLVLVSKESLSDSNSAMAQGGLAAVAQPSRFSFPHEIVDSSEQHLSDTLRAGAGLADEKRARSVIEDAPELLMRLEQLGVKFDRARDGSFDLAREGGHSQARVLHSKDATGRALITVLIDALRQQQIKSPDKVVIFEHAQAVDLLKVDGRVTGCLVDLGGEAAAIAASFTVLATGGAGQIYARTTNPDVATGDGIALAYRAGAELVDLEFMQFHPTALALPGARTLLVSEAVRGAGAVLRDAKGEAFVGRFHPDADLATRDVVSRAIHETMMEQGLDCVYLDMTALGEKQIAERFPNIRDSLLALGIDPALNMVPVCPAAHYYMGGINTDTDGRTSMPGLYAIGECASTGLHGANRLASNSLLEGAVMALRVCRRILKEDRLPMKDSIRTIETAPFMVPDDLADFRRQMYQSAGLVRDRIGLLSLIERLGKQSSPLTWAKVVEQPKILQQANMLTLGKLIAEAALSRRESRGCHLRRDYPYTDDNLYRDRSVVSKRVEPGERQMTGTSTRPAVRLSTAATFKQAAKTRA